MMIVVKLNICLQKKQKFNLKNFILL